MAIDENHENRLKQLVQELRASLKRSTVLTPNSEGYTESIKRWSDAVEKRAVMKSPPLPPGATPVRG